MCWRHCTWTARRFWRRCRVRAGRFAALHWACVARLRRRRHEGVTERRCAEVHFRECCICCIFGVARGTLVQGGAGVSDLLKMQRACCTGVAFASSVVSGQLSVIICSSFLPGAGAESPDARVALLLLARCADLLKFAQRGAARIASCLGKSRKIFWILCKSATEVRNTADGPQALVRALV